MFWLTEKERGGHSTGTSYTPAGGSECALTEARACASRKKRSQSTPSLSASRPDHFQKNCAHRAPPHLCLHICTPVHPPPPTNTYPMSLNVNSLSKGGAKRYRNVRRYGARVSGLNYDEVRSVLGIRGQRHPRGGHLRRARAQNARDPVPRPIRTQTPGPPPVRVQSSLERPLLLWVGRFFQGNNAFHPL